MKMDVLSALHLIAEVWISITPTTIKSSFVKCGFLIDHAISNFDRVVTLTGEAENDRKLFKTSFELQSEEYSICDGAPKVWSPEC
jgi:hypothetical protein